MDRVGQIRVFLEVANSSSFTAAAKALKVSRASTSEAIRGLEVELGTRLFNRTTRKVRMTAEGEVFRQRARRILADYEAAMGLFRPDVSAPVGLLTVDAPTRITNRVIIPALPDFMGLHPDIKLSIGSTERGAEWVNSGIDVALRLGPTDEEAASVRHLANLRQINCASPAYIAQHGAPTDLKSLKRHRLVHFSPECEAPPLWEYIDSNGDAATLEVSSDFEVDNAESYVAAGVAGLGLIQAPAFDVAHHIESGALVAVLGSAVAPPMPLHAVFPTFEPAAVFGVAFVDWVAGLLRSYGMATPLSEPLVSTHAA